MTVSTMVKVFGEALSHRLLDISSPLLRSVIPESFQVLKNNHTHVCFALSPVCIGHRSKAVTIMKLYPYVWLVSISCMSMSWFILTNLLC